MSNFPTEIDEFRSVENLPGITYKPSDLRTFFAEDYNNLAGAMTATQTEVQSLAEAIEKATGIMVVDTFNDLPGNSETGTVALVTNGALETKAEGNFENDQIYPEIYTRPVIEKSSLPADENLSAHLKNGPTGYSVVYNAHGEEIIIAPHIQLTRLEQQGDQMWQVQYLYFWEAYDIKMFNRNIHFYPGWNRLAVHLSYDEELGLSLYSDVIQNYSCDDFVDLKAEVNESDSVNILNKIFSTTPFVYHKAGIYEKIGEDWEIIVADPRIGRPKLAGPTS